MIVEITAECAEKKLNETVDALKKAGMEIDEVDDVNGVVTGTVDAGKVAEIRSWPCVNYVRVEFTYIADYPPGDPRNEDPSDPAEEDSDD